MENKRELIIVSTTSSGVKEDDTINQLFLKPTTRNCCELSFEGGFYPLIGIKNNGIVDCFCELNTLSNELELIIMPHAEHFDNNPYDFDGIFSSFIKESLEKLDTLYILLHQGEGSIHMAHQNNFLKLAKTHLGKIRIAKCHHTRSVSNDPTYAIGDGLGIIAEAIINKNNEDLLKGLEYLKTRPLYYSPLLEYLIHIYKSASILPLILNNNWNEVTFNSEKAKLLNSDYLEFAKHKLEKIVFRKEPLDYLAQLNDIESEINQLSFT